MSSPARNRNLVPLATATMAASAVMMAYQVASRATRDTLFLSNFNVASLPQLVAAASAVSIASALFAARANATYGPARVIPIAFFVSALLTLAEWGLVMRRPDVGAIVVYLHVAAFGPVLASGFWSMISERFDPRSAKREIGRIAGIGTLGGLAGGLLAERVTAWFGVSGTLPALALAHAWCAWSMRRLPSIAGAGARPRTEETLAAREVGRRLRSIPYLRNLALLVLSSSVSAALLDFVFKAQASGVARQSLDLMRVFTIFYTLVAVVTFAVQALVSRVALERAGLARTIGTLPGAVVAGGAVAALVPGPWSVGLARGFEAVLRGSLFRAGYELLYTPIPSAEKRATKALVDVGCDRLGEAVGAGIIVLVLTFVPIDSTRTLLVLSVLVAVATLAVAARLQPGYVTSLEAGLRAGAVDLDQLEVADGTTRLALKSLGVVVPSGPMGAGLSQSIAMRTFGTTSDADQASVSADVTEVLRTLRSGNTLQVRAALKAATRLDALLVPQTIQLLAADEVAAVAAQVLVPVALRHQGQLIDALLDPESDFSVRRRIPPVLATCPTARIVDGLTRGLADDRFEVRYRCGRALARILGRESSLEVDRNLILGAVRREATVGREVWDSQRLLDQLKERGEEGLEDEFLRDRASRSLEHVFTLLSLVLPREPLQIAFRGLYVEDRIIRGTALEYLESVLPPSVRDVLWSYLEPDQATRRASPQPRRDQEQVLDELLRSNQSIAIHLDALRLRAGDKTDSEGA